MTSLPKKQPRPSTIAPGREYRLGREASVQFSCTELRFRVIKVLPREWDDGWRWVVGYALSPATGEAVERRELFLQESGVKLWVPDEPPPLITRTVKPAPAPEPARRSSAPR